MAGSGGKKASDSDAGKLEDKRAQGNAERRSNNGDFCSVSIHLSFERTFERTRTPF